MRPLPETPLASLWRPALMITLLLWLLTGLAYPLLTTAVAHVLFPYQAQGSLLRKEGKVVGSRLIGQAFTSPRYFHPRPSATSPESYNAAQSSGSNLGPTNARLIQAVQERVRQYRQENGLGDGVPVPVDAVTASGSGLDPDISLANTQLQAARVAKARGIPLERVRQLIREHIRPRQFGLLGEPRVNVLELNLALDGLR
ncbi:potassium-transporting ATPase subunit KdpC [Meiothermus granaticius]|uniref:Potassium-transporting ATPase KdpC subunit n=1 Tax=Meiothermus granaticius NBRC 107808 TaxID=1227551 RepID=A0A399F995_9DEIN|nr:potassium-transporting ATPase subunit KdpC [Meiothermus granaticius]RIH91482.1 Potassium-transporting ATPase KdpC subunit [Meiothermus granaticius NBRC 107808]GEM88282.1 potassium-transporting ATPase KdpC subunit [Meiothermus granaticius NBRC 107808]